MQTSGSFDVQGMLSDFDHDADRFAAMAKSVIAELPHHVATMRDGLAAGRLESLEFAARSLAMLFDSLLAVRAADAARDLENAARLRSLEEAEPAFESLEFEIGTFIDEVAVVIS